MTFDPSDFSWLDPTVHTYGAEDITDRSARLRGYVMPGSSDIQSQGFEYWSTGTPDSKRKVKVAAPAIGTNVQTVLSSGQVMTAELASLQPATTYAVRTFVTTDEGTFYGEETEFTTEGIAGIPANEADADSAYPVAYFNQTGLRSDAPFKGFNIVLMSDGTTRKLIVR